MYYLQSFILNISECNIYQTFEIILFDKQYIINDAEESNANLHKLICHVRDPISGEQRNYRQKEERKKEGEGKEEKEKEEQHRQKGIRGERREISEDE